jgi:MOSC domain-containing protein YiiM/SAM-dependent methyltransferase
VTERIHPTAARGFATAADAYERGRPEYPADGVAAIVEHLDLRPGRTLLELGAGTGKLTRLLAPSGARILALEPVAEMRSRLVAVVPSAEPIDGTAEAIPLAAESVDGVVVAQAFHWFNAVRALSEVHRVLRPGGRLVLAWNRRDERVPWVRALGEAIHALAAGEPQVRDAAWRAAIERCALFEPFASAGFRHVQSLTREGVLERASSVSYVAAADPAARSRLLAEIGAILDSDPLTAGRDLVELPYDTEVMWATRRSPSPGGSGLVASVNVNAGGVAKPPIDGSWIRASGLDGDGHREPEPIHGGPDRAVCLYAQEAIERVRADGHQAFPGAFGENLTVLGLDWGALRAGDRLVIGSNGAVVELTSPAAPCATIARWFQGGRIGRVETAEHPEDARWYARVLREGPVAAGMPVRREPASRYPVSAHGGTMSDPQPAAPAATAPTREQLLARHAEARRRRNAAELGSHEWAAASAEVGMIEIEIARVEREMDPPRV